MNVICGRANAAISAAKAPHSRGYEQEIILSEKPLSFYSQKAADLATQIDAALSLVPQSEDGVDLAAADMLFLGPDISDLLREIAGMPPLSRS